MFDPAAVWAKWWGRSLLEAGRKQGEEVVMQAKFVPGSFLFSGCTWKSTSGGVHAVCMRGDRFDWDLEPRNLAFKILDFLERQSTVSCFTSQVAFQMRTSDAPAWVSKIQIQTRRIALKTVTETPQVYVVCTVGGDNVWTLTINSRNSAFLPSNCGLFFFLSTL